MEFAAPDVRRLRRGRYEINTPDNTGRWTIEIGEPEDVTTVAIEGQRCGCLNAEDAESQPLRFTATYCRYVAPEVAVEFCALDSIRLADGQRDLSFDAGAPARLRVRATSRAWHNGAEISSELRWMLEHVQSGGTLTPEQVIGAEAEFTYEGLPERNDAFGAKALTVRATHGPCECRGRVDRSTQRPTGVVATGIDCFAEVVRHEWQHHLDDLSWWPNGYIILLDSHFDRLPQDVELREPGCIYLCPWSCRDRPFSDVTDRELNAYWAGWTWVIGTADRDDWSCGGKQWKGGKCPE